MSKLSRTKGAAFEREIANALKPLWPNARPRHQATHTAPRLMAMVEFHSKRGTHNERLD